jgi:hypothetical protein
MQKRAISKSIRGCSLTEIFLLVTMTFAVAFMLGESVKTVSAYDKTGIVGYPGTGSSTSSFQIGQSVSLDGHIVRLTSGPISGGYNYVDTSGQAGFAEASNLKLTSSEIVPVPTPAVTTSGPNQVVGGATGVVAANNLVTVGNPLASQNVLKATKDFDLGGQHFAAGTQFTKAADGSYTTTVNGAPVSIAKPDSAFFGNTVNVPAKDLFVASNPGIMPVVDSNGISTFTKTDPTTGAVTTTKFDAQGKMIGAPSVEGGIEPYKIGDTTIASGGNAALLRGAQWALVAYGIGQMIGSMAGMDKSGTKALSNSLAAGAFAYQAVQALGKGGYSSLQGSVGNWLAKYPGYVGLAVAVVVFLLTYKKQKQQLVSFQCLPYEPPLGGSACEKCNANPLQPCSEYRCKALGQACELLNKGTTHEACTWVSPKDVNTPIITPWAQALKPTGLVYNPDNAVRPGAHGVKITSTASDGCLPAYTPLQFGITTNEPAQCMIDYNMTTNFTDMRFYFGDNYYSYNHTEQMSLPSPSSADTDMSPLLQNDGSMSLFVRCQDANGNANVDAYSISFCVSKAPDTTPPVIVSTSITDGSAVQYNADNVPIEVYVNEPATCKWSNQDKTYDDMENNMKCATDASQVNAALQYTCSGNLTSVTNQQDNKYYFRCMDQPDANQSSRNVMRQSYSLTLRGTQPLNIVSVGPNSTVSASTSVVPVDLTVETDDGADTGKAVCYFSPSGSTGSYVQMYKTNDVFHDQPLSLTAGDYDYFIRCVDSGGNSADTNTTFSVSVDNQAPIVTRVYKQGTDTLQIITNENAQCYYSMTSCNYEIKDGQLMSYANPDNQMVHTTGWKANSPYYIKCRDQFGNEPNPNSCSIIATGLNLDVKAKTNS